MVRGLFMIVFGVACLQAGQAYATDAHECAQLRGKGASVGEKIPPFEDVDRLIECAGMGQDVKDLDRLDRDLLVIRASYSTLAQWREKVTDTNPPRKYSDLAPAKRLEKFKQLVDAYYKRHQAK